MYEQFQPERISITIERNLTDDDASRVKDTLAGLPGVSLEGVSGQDLRVEFYPGSVSRGMIVEALAESGFIEVAEEQGGAMRRRLERMAESSKREFGSGKLDCCNLNDKR